MSALAKLVRSDSIPFGVPGPHPSALLGRAGNLLRFAIDPIGVVGAMFQEYGKVVALVEGGHTRLIAPRSDCPGTVFVQGPELNRLTVTQHDLYEKSALGGAEPFVPQRVETLWRLGTGLFHVNGEAHRQHRRLLMPAFHKKQVEAYRDDMIGLIQRMLDRWQVNERRDVQKDMTRLTLNIAGKTLFGESESDVETGVGSLLEQLIRGLLGTWVISLLRYDVPGSPYHMLLDKAQQVDAHLRQIIAHKRHSGQDDTDVLAMLIRAEDETGVRLTDDEIIGHAAIIFMAGHETTANALTWTLLLLTQHPRIAAALFDELDGVLHGHAPSLEQLAQLPLLERVIKESLRVLPPVPFNHRITADTTTLDSYTIPAGTEVFVSIYHTHLDPDLFPDPQRFDPDRWLTINPSPFEYNPFSAGPRMCIGATFAMQEIKLVLATLLQRYRLEFIPGTHLDRRVKVTMAPRQGLPLIIRRQDRQFGSGVGPFRGMFRKWSPGLGGEIRNGGAVL